MRRKKNKNNKNIEEFIQRIRREDKRANSEFNKIPKYYINLERSKDRQKHMLKQFVDYEVENIERFKAIDGNYIKDLRKGEVGDIKYINDYPDCTKYELAITLSHLECMRKAGEKGAFPFIIMEDDVDFLLINRWKKNIDQVIDEMPETCDILHLFSHHGNKKGYILNKDHTGAVCYIITRQGYDKLLKLLYDSEKNIWNFNKNLNLEDIVIDDGIRKLYNRYNYYPGMFLQSIDSFKSCHIGRANCDKNYKILYYNIIYNYLDI